ncbi:MAG TPA: hypothetical protein VLT13_12395, partial [Bacteroidota bacterium]|nr:hypothetical protein [Bacteroidota bacterium]
MRMHMIGLTFLLLCCGTALLRAQEEAISKAEYLAYMKPAADDAWASLEADRETWRKSVDVQYVFGYNPPGNEVYLAALSANLFGVTGDQEYLRRAKKLLLEFGRHRDAYPRDYAATRAEFDNCLPVVPNLFFFGKYCHAYAIV